MSEEVSINSGRWEKLVECGFADGFLEAPPKNVTCLEHETIYMYTNRMKKDGHFCSLFVTESKVFGAAVVV